MGKKTKDLLEMKLEENPNIFSKILVWDLVEMLLVDKPNFKRKLKLKGA